MRPISAVKAVPARRHHRSQFAHQRERDQHAERLLGAITLEGIVALQAKHETDEHSGHGDDDQRIVAEKIDLFNGQPETPEAGAGITQR